MNASSFNPSRLSLARRRRGHTKASLAKVISVSVRMVTDYESGRKEPSEATLENLAKELEFPFEFFSGSDLDMPPIEGSSFRALSKMTAKQRDQALGAGSLAMALSDWIAEKFNLPEPNVPQYEGLDPETASLVVRSEWGLGERPIKDTIRLLEYQGVRIFSLAEHAIGLDAYSFWRGQMPYIFLNTTETAERNRMDAAHELGHLVLHWKGGARGREAEKEASQFGSAFLMPKGSVVSQAPRGGRLSQIIKAKKRWNVSASSLVYRMRELNMLSEWQARTLFMEITRRYGRSEPNGARSETSQVLEKVFSSLREDAVSMGRVAKELSIYTEELNKMVFGLVLTSIPGSSRSHGQATGGKRPNLEVV